MKKFLSDILNVRDERRQLLYIILFLFILSFLIARLISVYTGHSLFIRGYQIHHFYFGTIALSVGGILGTLSRTKWPLRFASGLIGIGIGLFGDEIGLLLNCTTQTQFHRCNYQFPDAFDFIIVIAVLIFFVLIMVGLMDKIYFDRVTRNRGQ